jgi:hypothetical protein
MIASLTDMSGVEQWLWKMKRSAPRIDSPNLQCSSPLRNSVSSTGPSPRPSAFGDLLGELAVDPSRDDRQSASW